MSSYFIRKAQPEDVKVIFDLVTELAIYEKLADFVTATPDILRASIFEKKQAHALLAYTGSEASPGEPIGLALYFFNFSTFTGKAGLYLEDLVVKEQHRGLGVGKGFFGELGKIAQENGCPRLDWAVLKWNKPSIDFYEKKLGATAQSEWVGMRLQGEEIKTLDKYIVKSN